MAEKFKNTYRIPSARLQSWDYGSNAAYFVTICTAGRAHFFGKIEKEQMEISEMGKMADQCWLAIPEHFPFVKLDAHIIMPNHVHGIIIIDKPDEGHGNLPIQTVIPSGNDVPNVPNGPNGSDGPNGPIRGDVETQDLASLPANPENPANPTNPEKSMALPTPSKNKFGPQSRNLASIIRGFKTGVSKHARSIHPDFAWQSRFHDHIIKEEASYHRIAAYIISNPQKWQEDKFFSPPSQTKND